MSKLKHYSKSEPSEVGTRVADLLDDWVGLHHLDQQVMSKVDWTNPRFIRLPLGYMRMSTFDFNELTTLVFLAHDRCIRVEVAPCNPQRVYLIFHPRGERSGSITERHPTLEQAVAEWRDRHPIEEAAVPAEGGAT